MNKGLNTGRKQSRNSNIEFLRILSMLMILGHHFVGHGQFNWGGVEVSVPYCWYLFLFMWGKVGVNVFVLISGYYLIDASEYVDIHKTMKIIGQVLFYSISISCVRLLLGESEINLSFIKDTFFPITYSLWWFASAYFVLYIVHPYINILLKRLTPLAFQKIVAIMLILWCVIPTFLGSQYQSNYFL